MKKQLTTLTLLLSFVSIQSWANPIPNGTYRGNGLHRSINDTGDYKVQTIIQDNIIKTEYTLVDGSKKEWDFEMISQPNDIFKVVTRGLEVGQGYCLMGVSLCHYEIKINSFTLEETFTLENGQLYRFGSKDDGNGRIIWQESAIKDSAEKIIPLNSLSKE